MSKKVQKPIFLTPMQILGTTHAILKYIFDINTVSLYENEVVLSFFTNLSHFDLLYLRRQELFAYASLDSEFACP